MTRSITWDDHGHPHSSDGSHVHECADGCGAFYGCAQHDGCDRDWICPRCEQERLDHYVTLLANKETEQTAQRSA